MILRNHGTLTLGSIPAPMRSCACTILNAPARCRSARSPAALSGTGPTRASRRKRRCRARWRFERHGRRVLPGPHCCASSTGSIRATSIEFCAGGGCRHSGFSIRRSRLVAGRLDIARTLMKFGSGQSVRRTEDIRFITGHGQYTDDLRFDRETFVAFVRSPQAHAQDPFDRHRRGESRARRRRGADASRSRSSRRADRCRDDANARAATARCLKASRKRFSPRITSRSPAKRSLW